MKKFLLTAFGLVLLTGVTAQNIGDTEITKWQGGKRGAVSITYDDGSRNQFRVAVPIMNRLGLPGTFFINTGSLPGSTYKGKFIGRPLEEIAQEARTVSTTAENIRERASAARFAPVRGAGTYFASVGAAIDAGRTEEAIAITDDFYAKFSAGELEPVQRVSPGTENDGMGDEATDAPLTWDMVRRHTAEGHEFASHMVTHPYVCALDAANLDYELEMSRREMMEQVDFRSTISAECPYGVTEATSIARAHKTYPVLRNGMFLDRMPEIHRGDRTLPMMPAEEYVQWQRGIVTRTTLAEMNGWVDTTAAQENLWLVTVIHGVDGIGWEAMTGEDMDAHFSHIAASGLWVATFGDVGRYILERGDAVVNSRVRGRRVEVTVDHSLDKALFDLPLTLKTQVDPAWEKASVKQGRSVVEVPVVRGEDGAWVMYSAVPGGGKIVISD